MNNKSDKKRKRKQKQNQPKNKKKTTSHQSKKKKEIKGGGGGVWSFSKGSKTKKPPNRNKWKNENTLLELQEPFLSNSSRLENAKRANLNNSQPPPPPPPNAHPQGFNTLKAQSRCSIL